MQRNRRRLLRIAGIAGAAGTIGFSWGCELTPNPVTGRPELILMSQADEREIGEKHAKEVEGQMGLVQNPDLQAYVSELGARLSRRSPRKGVDYRFQVLEMEGPNAFALPDGRIYVTRELLLLTNSEAELANVLAHEIGHVAARHHAQRDAHRKTFGLSTLAGRIASGGTDDQEEFIGGIDGVWAYSRNQERQADSIGMELATNAGFRSEGMATFLRTLDRASRLEAGYSMTQYYFSSHPATPERIAEASSRAEVDRHSGGLRTGPVTNDAYLERFDGIAAQRPAAEGVFVKNRFLHADLGFSLRFPPGWELVNQNAQVVGLSPRRDGLVMLQLAGEGDDPEALARQQAEEGDFELREAAPVRVAGRSAFRAQVSGFPTSFGPVNGSVTWVLFDGAVYRLVAGVDEGNSSRYAGIFRSFSRSLRPLKESEREEIGDLRVWVVSPLEGESLSELSRRTNNEWKLGRTAVVNGRQIDDRLEPEERIKVAVRRNYPDNEGTATPPH